MAQELLDRYKDEIERIGQEAYAIIEPCFPQINEMARVAVAAIEPALESMATAYELYRGPESFAPYLGTNSFRSNTREVVADHKSQVVHLTPGQFKQLMKAASLHEAQNELLYDWGAAEFSRIALGQKISYPFVAKDNKRRRLVEKIMRERNYVTTKTLSNILGVPEKRVSNMITEINNDIGRALSLPVKLIDGQRGRGYRINPAYALIQKR